MYPRTLSRSRRERKVARRQSQAASSIALSMSDTAPQVLQRSSSNPSCRASREGVIRRTVSEPEISKVAPFRLRPNPALRRLLPRTKIRHTGDGFSDGPRPIAEKPEKHVAFFNEKASKRRDSRRSSSSPSQMFIEDSTMLAAAPSEASSGILLVAGPETGTKSMVTADGSMLLHKTNAVEYTAFAWSSKKKWWILIVVALCQTSMNYNAAVYSNAVEPLNNHYGITNARMGMLAFLVSYAFGCELWAPWSEELGRWPVMQFSLGLVNLAQLLPLFSVNWSMVLAGRIIGGVSSAGGSVTLGMVADMFEPDHQQLAVLFASFSSCVGSVIGGVCGGPIEQYFPWRWNFGIQLIFGFIVQVVHFFGCKETRSTVILDQEAKQQRRRGQKVFGPNNGKTWGQRFPPREILKTMWRPYHMLVTEPIVLFLSLLSGFSDALIFSFLESYGYVYGPDSWNFSKTQLGLAMVPLLVGYMLAFASFYPVILRDWRHQSKGRELLPERRLWWLQYQVALLPIGLLGSAFVVKGPPVPWIAPLLFSVLIGMANFSIYYATLDYMVAAYGEKYAASATGGNGFARDFLAGICVLFTKPMYKRLGSEGSMFLLFGISACLAIPVYLFYRWGHWFRARSPMVQGTISLVSKRYTEGSAGAWQYDGEVFRCTNVPDNGRSREEAQ